MALLQQNRMAEAKSLCAALCAKNPADAQLQFLMSAICGHLGDFVEGEKYCTKAISLNPNVPEAWYNLAVAQLRLGKTSAAINNFTTAIRLRPAFPEALNELGNAYQQAGSPAEAVAFHERAIRARSNYPQAYCNLGTAQAAAGDHAAAAQSFKAAMALDPELFEARIGLGKSLLRLGQDAAAKEQFDVILARNPAKTEAIAEIAAAYTKAGLPADAASCYERAISQEPSNASLLSNYGAALTALGRNDEAIDILGRAVHINPELAEAHFNLAIALRGANRQEAAESSYLQALSIRDAFPEAWMNLGTLRLLQGRLHEARDCFARALMHRADYPDAASNLLMALNYDDAYSADEVFRRHLDWGSDLTARTPDVRTKASVTKRAGTKLRIGFVSPDFRAHSVAYFFQSLLDHQRPDVELICYSNTTRPDAVTTRIRNGASQWRDITRLDDDEAAALIRQDGLDALIDLAGHTSGNRLGIFARRPCAAQITYLGYPNTTGLPSMDFRITDDIADPPHSRQRYTERLLRMNRCFLCYQPTPSTPKPVPLDHDPTRPITFGSFNNLAKLTPQTVELWSRILHELPGSILTLKAAPLGEKSVATRHLALFHEHGIPADRLRLIGWLPNADHLDAYNRIDVALDTHPYNGTTTTCEALWMGRPVVTMEGDLHASRVGASLLSAIGLTELIARTPDEYVATAVSIASMTRSPDHRYSDIRARMESSPLCDRRDFQERFISIVETAISASTVN